MGIGTSKNAKNCIIKKLSTTAKKKEDPLETVSYLCKAIPEHCEAVAVLPEEFAERRRSIECILEKMLTLQKDPFQADHQKRDEFASQFLAWCQEKEIGASNVQLIRDQYGGIGLMAKERMPKDAVIIWVPIEAAILSRNALAKFRSLIYDAMQWNNDSFWTDTVATALMMVDQRVGVSSSWKPYIDILPKYYADHPFYFCADDFCSNWRCQKFSKFFRTSTVIFLDICEQYALLYEKILRDSKIALLHGNLTPNNFTYEVYRWAMCTAVSRTIANENNEILLFPFWDLCNHGEPNMHSYFVEEELTDGSEAPSKILGLQANASRDIEAGEELLINYNPVFDKYVYFNTWGIIL